MNVNPPSAKLFVRRALAVAVVGAALGFAPDLRAFPPYRSTDAGTADPWVLEPRLGLIRATRDDGDISTSAPLGRLNLGLPHHFEIVTEAEYSHDDERLGDAAMGGKWIPFPGELGAGTEVLVLLPVSDAGGVGLEAQALLSYRPPPLRLHLNGGGFADGRTEPSERGWRGSLLAEVDLGSARPGVELFGKQVSGDAVRLLAGLGTIADLGAVDLRLGVHAGLTEASPELVGSIWVSTEIRLADPSPASVR